jgi:hypothetical protein
VNTDDREVKSVTVLEEHLSKVNIDCASQTTHASGAGTSIGLFYRHKYK